jgi:hypothetical protein
MINASMNSCFGYINMNSGIAIAPVMILGIIVLIAVLFAVITLLKNPNGRKVFPTILTVMLIVGGIFFAGLFTLRVSHFPGPGMNSMPGPNALWNLPMMMLKPVLLLCVIFLVVGVIRGVKTKKFATGTVMIVAALLVPALLLLFYMPMTHVRQVQTSGYNGSATLAEPLIEVDSTVPLPRGYKANSPVPLPPAYTTPSIWQDSVADQFTANVYPSKAAALKGLRPKIDEVLRKAADGKQTPPKVVLFAGGLSATEVHSLMDSPEVEAAAWIVEPLPRNLQENEISIGTNFALTSERTESHGDRFVMKMRSGALDVYININSSSQSPPTNFKAIVEEKPWLTDLAGYQSTYPNSRFLVARSHSSATDEKTAEQEAITDACSQVAQVLWEMNPNHGRPLSGNLSVNPTDLESRGFVLDRFSQQLYGMAGPICRNALLIDLSPEKIQPLANAKFEIVARQQKTWARVLLSFVGMAAVIALVYAFLNAATRGYYSWSLRIAALALLAAGVVIVLSLAGHFGFPI